ncbi:MAG: TIGR02186 family protein [Pseudomonadota bacterium]
MARLIFCLALFFAAAASAEERVVAVLSQHNVSLTTGFAGSEIYVSGAVRHVGGSVDVGDVDVIITITGPVAPVTVRKKERQFGIWVNNAGVQIDAAPSFYAVASTKTFRETVSWTDDLRYKIGLNHIIRLVDAPVDVEREDYRAAVARIRRNEGLYKLLPNSIEVHDNTLFVTRITLPANLVEGDYTARIFLLRNKAVTDVFYDTIEVRRAGLGRLIYTSAQDHPALYGIFSIFVALAAGWLASAFFRTFFPT